MLNMNNCSVISPSVAIVGADSGLGSYIASAFLMPQFRYRFYDVVLLSSSPSEELSQKAEQGNARVAVYKENDLAAGLKGIDVLVNISGPNGHAFEDDLVRSLLRTTVKLYFPSEFGADYTIHNYSQPEWDRRRRHYDLATETLGPGNTKICRVFVGLLLEDSVGPWFGFDTKNGHYESIGKEEAGRTTYTSKEDIGKAVAALASLPVWEVPEIVHLAGDCMTMSEVAKTMTEAGAGEIEVSSIELERYKEAALRSRKETPEGHLRFLMGEGKLDYSHSGLGNDNELVNRKQQRWRWKTVSDLAKETMGRPWGDVTFPG